MCASKDSAVANQNGSTIIKLLCEVNAWRLYGALRETCAALSHTAP